MEGGIITNKLVSVIVPIYKVEKYLEKCINSIISQTYKNIEIILVDDGSPDNCGKICDNYAKKDKRIKTFHKKNGGLSDARNYGLKKSIGEYILFVDSDDWIDPEMVEILVNSLEKNNTDISICGIKLIKNNDVEYLKWFKEDTILQKEEALKMLLENKVITNHAWNKLYRKEIIEKTPFPKGKLYEDARIMHNVFLNCNSVSITKEYLYNYLIRDTSISGVNKIENNLDYIDAFIKRYEDMKDISQEYKEICYYQICNIIGIVFTNYVFTEEDKNIYKEKLESYMTYIKKGSKSIKKYADKKEKLRILFVKIFKYNAAKIKVALKENYKNINPTFKNKIKSIIKCEKIPLNSSTKKVYVFLSADYGNFGDIAITYAQKEYLSSILPGYEIIEIPASKFYNYILFLKRKITEEDIITIVGGGNLGNLYEDLEEMRRTIIKKFKKNLIVSFPQTIIFSNDDKGKKSLNKTKKIYSKHKKLILLAREVKSFNRMKEVFLKNEVYLVPDIVLWLKDKVPINNCKSNKIGICIREDIERSISAASEELIRKKLDNNKIENIHTHINDENIIFEKKYEQLFNLLKEINNLKFLITDRLHGMIFAYITGTPCIVFDNNNHKIKETYEKWLKDCNYIFFLSEKNISNLESYIDKIPKKKKYNECLSNYYTIIEKKIKENLEMKGRN